MTLLQQLLITLAGRRLLPASWIHITVLRAAVERVTSAGDLAALGRLGEVFGTEAIKLDGDPDQLTTLHWAAAAGSESLLQFLLVPPVNADPNACRINNFSALHAAAMNGHAGACRRLVEAGAAINVQTAPQGYSPLHSAAFGGHRDVIRLLLECGADRELRNYRHERPGETARRAGQTDTAVWFESLPDNPQTSMSTPDGGWNAKPQLITRDVTKLALYAADRPLSFAGVIELWAGSPAFRLFWAELLRQTPCEGFCLELPPLTSSTLTGSFECVTVASPMLSAAKADPQPFASYFHEASGAEFATFESLGRDALLVAPCPTSRHANYSHLGSFLRTAPPAQAAGLWQAVAGAVKARLGDSPVWLSTAGLGVSWLHVRVDSRPKYYRYDPYRQG